MMLRRLVTLLLVCWASSPVRADEQTLERRLFKGETPERFEKQIKPLVAGIRMAKRLVVYEGLPHQRHKEVVAKELKDKKTVKFHDFHFYAETVAIDKEDAKTLTALCGELKTFGRYEGAKFCGGYHPDWCLEFKNGDDVYQVLICFGCHEARLYGPNHDVFSDLDSAAVKELEAILSPLHKNVPKGEDKK